MMVRSPAPYAIQEELLMIRFVQAFFVVALVLVTALPSPGQSGFSPEDKSFSISVPSGWVAIPALELYLFENPGRTGPVPPEEIALFRKTRMGFQKPAEQWFTTPYMIITLETGKKRGPQELFMDHVLAEKDSEAHATGNGHRFLEKDHMPTKRMHYYKDVSYSPAQGKKIAMGAYTYLTSRGFLRVAWFVDEDQLRAYESVLHQSAMSVKLSQELEYKPEGKQ